MSLQATAASVVELCQLHVKDLHELLVERCAYDNVLILSNMH